jgi:hypothetical protein
MLATSISAGWMLRSSLTRFELTTRHAGPVSSTTMHNKGGMTEDFPNEAQQTSVALVALGYVTAVLLTLPVLLLGRVQIDLLTLHIGVTGIGFTIAGRKLQERGSARLARLGGFVWALTPPLVGMSTALYVAVFTHGRAAFIGSAGLLATMLLAAYFYDRRPSAFLHLWCFGTLLAGILALTTPVDGADTGLLLAALGVAWSLHTRWLSLQPAWLDYALGALACVFGLVLLVPA